MLYRLLEVLELAYDYSAYIFFSLLIVFSIYSLFTMNKIKITGWRYRELNDIDMKIISREIDNMDSRTFECFMAYLFEQTGEEVEITKPTRDGGYDICLNSNTYVEIKHYSENNLVSRPVIQKLIGAMIENNIRNGIVVTTSAFTKEAYNCMQKCKDVNISFMYKNDILDICEIINSTKILQWLGYDKNQITETYQW